MKEKGQIEIAFLVLVIIAIILAFNLPGKETTETKIAQVSKPVFKEKEESPSVPLSTSSESDTFTPSVTTSDTTPPRRFNSEPTGDLPCGTLKTFISLETDEKAICRYSAVSGMSYNSMRHIFSNTNAFSHSTLITTLTEGEEFNYYIKCADQSDNKNTDDFVISFKVKAPEDVTPPDRRNLEPIGVLPSGTTKTIISLSTDEPAYCRYSTKQGVSYNSMRRSFSRNKMKTYHTAKIKDLIDGKTYDYFVRCKDLKGNKNTNDVMIRFSVGTAP